MSESLHCPNPDLLVSVVIPCFNQGKSLMETLDSVLKQTFQDLEVVIVNDGSDDSDTVSILKTINFPNVQILHTENQGLAEARNNGIRAAQGQMILPLDADDLIAAGYVEQAVTILAANAAIGIVYCRAKLFGAVDTEWLLPPYSLHEMLLDNVIFSSAMFRKSDWEMAGGYDAGMIYGWEDYDFWLSLLELGREVYQIPEVLFYYRVASDSMIRSKERWQKAAMFKRIFQRHEELFTNNIEVWIDSLLEVREPYYTSKLYVDTGNGISDADCINRKVELGTSEIQFSLDNFQKIKTIRFDPIDTPAVIELFKIIVTDMEGNSRELVEYTNNSILQVNNSCYFDNNDPQWYFDIAPSELEKIATFTVILSFKALANDALQQIVKLQQDKLQNISSALSKCESSGLIKSIMVSLSKHEDESVIRYFKRQLKLF